VNNEIDLHGRRTAWLCARLCKLFDMPEHQILDVALAALTHDIGKHALPVEILNKPAALTPEERRAVERHCLLGAKRLLQDAAQDSHESTTAPVAVALSHHEWWNGQGYPFGLAGVSIPRFARVVAVADVFDALMSARPYKLAWSLEETVAYIADRRDTQFDPECVEAMLLVARALPQDWRTAGENCALYLPAGAGPARDSRQPT